MINFKAPELSDLAAAAKAVADSGYIGSDASFANIFLLRQKYGTQIALQDGFLFRYYNGAGSRRGYAFPLGEGDAAAALTLIVEDAHKSGRPLEFCLVDEPRALKRMELLARNAPSLYSVSKKIAATATTSILPKVLRRSRATSIAKSAITFPDSTGLTRTTKSAHIRRKILQMRSWSKRVGSISKPWANPAIPIANVPANVAKRLGRNAPKMKNPAWRNTAPSARRLSISMNSA